MSVFPKEKAGAWASVGALVLLAGCGTGEEAPTQETPPAVAFEGAPDPRFVATWKNADGTSTYTLKPDGTYVLKGKGATPKGPVEFTNDGSWKVAKDRMLFRDKDGNVVPYLYSLKGEKLVLKTTGRMKNETVLTKR